MVGGLHRRSVLLGLGGAITSTTIHADTASQDAQSHATPALVPAGGINNQIQFNSNGTLSGFTMSGDVMVSATSGMATVSNGSVTWRELSAIYVESKAELGVGIKPTHFGYAVGNVLRYGADATGILDSTVAIQAAIDVAAAEGGCGQVYFPAGKFTICATINLRSNVTLVGAGYTTVLNGGAASIIFQATGISQFGIENCRISGTGPGVRETTYGVFICHASAGGRFYRVRFDAMYIGIGADSGASPPSSCIDIDFCQFENIGLNALGINSSGSNYRITNNHFRHCGLLGTTSLIGAAMELRGIQDSLVSGNIIRDCAYSSAGAVDGIRLEYQIENNQQVRRVSLTGNVITNVSGYGIRIQFGIDCNICGNVLIGGPNCSDGIVLLSDSKMATGKGTSGIFINGNSFSGWSRSAGVAILGTETANPVKGCTITGNSFSGGGYGVHADFCQDCVIAGNTIRESSGQGIYHGGGINTAIYGNVISGCSATGLEVGPRSRNVSLQINDIRANSTYGIFIAAGAASTVVLGNNCCDNLSGNYSINDSSTISMPLDRNGAAFLTP
jgi:parallel beta-helix repeat protein